MINRWRRLLCTGAVFGRHAANSAKGGKRTYRCHQAGADGLPTCDRNKSGIVKAFA